MIRTAIVTVSDSSHEGTRIDRSGPAVAAQLTGGLYEIAAQQVAPDVGSPGTELEFAL